MAMRKRAFIALLTAGVALTIGACAYDDYHYGRGSGGYAYEGDNWRGERQPYEGELSGPGVAILDPWLLETREGRAIVTLGWNDAGEGVISEEVAHRANIWFRRYADFDRDMKITDPEIRNALVSAAGRYLR
jgi:hypothetical protein